MITGVKALMFSADYFPEDENAKPDKLEEWLEQARAGGKAPDRCWWAVQWC